LPSSKSDHHLNNIGDVTLINQIAENQDGETTDGFFCQAFLFLKKSGRFFWQDFFF
jgi:hypothetical protein